MTCLEALNDDKKHVKASRCSGTGENQYWEYNNGIIGRDEFCIYFKKNKIKVRVKKNRQQDQVSQLLNGTIMSLTKKYFSNGRTDVARCSFTTKVPTNVLR